MSKKSEFILSENEISKLMDFLPKEGILILQGDLASGKTTLVKRILDFHKIKCEATSPTFSIMQQYERIYHYDIYNCGFDGILKNGLFENLFEDGLHIVEWGDDKMIEFLKKYSLDYTIVRISTYDDKRKYEVINA